MSDALRDERIKSLEALKAQGIDPYPIRCVRTSTAQNAHEVYDHLEVGEEGKEAISVTGRITGRRVMGGASFFDLTDGSGRIQLHASKDHLGEEAFDAFNVYELGDFIGATGIVFRTKRGELSVKVDEAVMLAKALRPLPEKWHGLKDVETRYRQRYLDLISNPESRDVFITRSKVIQTMRRILDERGFLEVETPILQPLYGGATAKPFTTFHNELESTLYLRISDELYLKRLIIGGYERVYEIGKNFRNEGISTKHSPEFTMMECYQAYADYHDMMDLTEKIVFSIAEELGSPTVDYQGVEIDFTPPWPRLPMREAILEKTGIDIETHKEFESLIEATIETKLHLEKKPNWGQLVDEIFSKYVEPDLIQPTFLIDHPLEISPLAKKKPDAPHLVERFEPFIAGREIGNAFSELNDPIDQRQRFEAMESLRSEGDEEAQRLDEEFITAMEHGMPPTGGLGIGVDRLVMLFTNAASIRDIILFPTLRQRDEQAS